MPKTKQVLLNSNHVGSMNRARIMRFLYAQGPMTRAELAQRLNVSRATIGVLVQPMLDGGILVEHAPLAVGEAGGKPARPLWFGDTRTFGAVYLSPDTCVAASIGMDGSVQTLVRRPVADDNPRVLLGELLAVSGEALAGVPAAAIGVAFAGMVDTSSGELIANYRRPAIGTLPVGKALSEAHGVPVFVDHHPRVTALGDAWFGLARDMSTFACVVTGEALGIGMMIDGQILRGVRGAGGEVGHIVVEIDGAQCVCGKRGCWETVATLAWLRREAATVNLAEAEQITSRRLAGAVDAGDPAADLLLDRYVARLAAGLASIEQTLGFGTYIMHGDVAEGGEVMRARLEAAVRANSPRRQPAPRLLLAQTEDNSTLLGAACLAMTNTFRARM